MTNLGHRPATGFADPANPNGSGCWTVRWRPDELPATDFEVYHAVILGPGGKFDVYLDDSIYSTGVRGDRNEYDPNNAMPVRKGQTIFFYWTISTGTRPTARIDLRTPTSGGII